jgi:hypothetical protein
MGHDSSAHFQRPRRHASRTVVLAHTVPRYFCWASHSDHRRFASRGGHRCNTAAARVAGETAVRNSSKGIGGSAAGRDGRFRPLAACLSPCLVGFSLGPMGGLAPRSSGPGGECHSPPGHRYPAQWKLNTLSRKVRLLCLVSEKTPAARQPVSRTLFLPPWAGTH